MKIADVMTSSFAHSDRPKKWPPGAALIANAGDLCSRVNRFLAPFYATKSTFEPERAVTSGYRPPAVNADVPGAVKGDAHETCQAVDLEDGNGELAAFCMGSLPEMKMAGLCMEDPRYTCTIKPGENPNIPFRHGWVHLQSRPVPSGNTVFIPYARPPP